MSKKLWVILSILCLVCLCIVYTLPSFMSSRSHEAEQRASEARQEFQQNREKETVATVEASIAPRVEQAVEATVQAHQLGEAGQLTGCDFAPHFSPERDVSLGGMQAFELEEEKKVSIFVPEGNDTFLEGCVAGQDVEVTFHMEGKYASHTEFKAIGPGQFVFHFNQLGKYRLFLDTSSKIGWHNMYIVPLTWFDWDDLPETFGPGIYQVVDGQENFELSYGYNKELKTHLVDSDVVEYDGITAWSPSNIMIIHPDDEGEMVTLSRESDRQSLPFQIAGYWSAAPLHLTNAAQLALGQEESMPQAEVWYKPGFYRVMTGTKLLIPGDHWHEWGSGVASSGDWPQFGHAYMGGSSIVEDEETGGMPFLIFETFAPSYLVIPDEAPMFYLALPDEDLLWLIGVDNNGEKPSFVPPCEGEELKYTGCGRG